MTGIYGERTKQNTILGRDTLGCCSPRGKLSIRAFCLRVAVLLLSLKFPDEKDLDTDPIFHSSRKPCPS
jgi:hypothetical protein